MDDCSLKEYYFMTLALCKTLLHNKIRMNQKNMRRKLWRFLDPPAQVLVLIQDTATTHRESTGCHVVIRAVRHRKHNRIREVVRLALIAASLQLRHITPERREPMQPARLAAEHREIPTLRAGQLMFLRRTRDNCAAIASLSINFAYWSFRFPIGGV